MLLQEYIEYFKPDPYYNPVREAARTIYAHRNGDEALIAADMVKLEAQLREDAAWLVAHGQRLTPDKVEGVVQQALSIARGTIGTEQYKREQQAAAAKVNVREVGLPTSPARNKRREEWREELDEEEHGNERNGNVRPTSKTPTRARGATQNSTLTEEQEMAKGKTSKATNGKGKATAGKATKSAKAPKEVKVLAAGHIGREEAAKRLKVSKSRILKLFKKGVLKGKSADELLETSVDQRAATVRNIGRRSVLGLGGVGPAEKPAKTPRAKKEKTAKVGKGGKNGAKKNSDAVAGVGVPKPKREKSQRKEKGAGLPTFENGHVADQTPVYAPVED